MKKIFIFFLFLFIPIQSFSIIYPIEPKYVSLKKNKVFSRWNASFEAPIRYVYHKKGLPVLIIRKKEVKTKAVATIPYHPYEAF